MSDVQPTDGGAYTVTVYNNLEALTTEPAELVVDAATDPPPTDDFADRPHLQGTEGVLQGNSLKATVEAGEPVFAGGGRSVWSEWLAPADGIMTISARGSAFDTLLGVFTGKDLGDLKPIAFDDDRDGFFSSGVQFNAREGESYQIMLDGFDYAGTGGPFTLIWQFEPSKRELPVIVVPPMTQAVLAGSNATFQLVAEPQDVSYQWFFEGKPIQGATGSVFSVLQASSDDVGFYSARLTSTSGLTRESPAFDLQIGTTPLAAMHFKYQSVSHSSANGNRPSAGFVSIGIGITDYIEAPMTNSEAPLTPCNSVSVAYRYRGLDATNNGAIYVTTEGSEMLTRLAVYLEPIIANPVPLACDTTSALISQPAKLLFDATAGVKYMVVAEAYQSDGDISLTSTMGVAPDVPESPDHCSIPPGGSIALDMPANEWVPAPAGQWQLNGQDLPGATGATLHLSNFNAAQAGTYSIVLSNFVRVVTNTVAILDLGEPLVLEPELVQNQGSTDLVIAVSNATPFLLLTKTDLNPMFPWTPVATNLEVCEVFHYTNANLLPEPQRFFRVVPWVPAP